MKIKAICALLTAGLLSTSLFACAQKQSNTSNASTAEGDSLKSVTLMERWDFSTGFYPANKPNTNSHGIQYWLINFYDTLVLREGNSFKGGLAKDWTISEDGMSYRFTIKENIQFSDGATLNASAVKTSLEGAIKNLDIYAASAGKLSTVLESIEAVDEKTLLIQLKSPYYGLLNDLALPYPYGIVSPNAFQADLTLKEDLMTKTLGSGPYMYQGDGDETSYRFVRNPHYYGEAPDADEFKVRVIADMEAAALALRSGELDIIPGNLRLSASGYDAFSKAEGFTAFLDEHISNTRFLGFNTQKPPFSDLRLRQAVAHAIDRSSLATLVFSNLETEANAFLDPGLPFCDVETTSYNYSIDQAKSLLESAGWIDSDGDGVREKDGLKLSVTLDYIQGFSFLDDAALSIAQSLKSIGLDVQLRGADNLSWYTNISKDDFDFSLHQSYGGYNDPYLIMSNMNPDLMSDPILAQVSYFLSKQKDTIVELDMTGDSERVQAIYREILTTNADQAILLPLTYMHQYAAYNSNKIASFSFGEDPMLVELSKIKLN